jgi:hypothetical protein
MTDDLMFHPKFQIVEYDTHNWTLSEFIVFAAILAAIAIVYKCSLMIPK